MDNNVNVVISQKEKDQALQAIETLNQLLGKYLIALTPEERQVLPKMSDKTTPFVEKTVEYTATNSEFAPPFLVPDAMLTDLNAVKTLNELFKPLNQIVTNLDDTITMCGSEAYVAALVYYNSVKQAAKVNVPDAKSIYEDLKVRFDGQGKKQVG